MKWEKGIWTTFLFLIVFTANSQVEVVGRFDSDSVEIGQPTNFTLSIKTTADYNVVAVSAIVVDSIYSAYQTAKSVGQDTAGFRPVLADFDVLSLGNWKRNDNDGVFAGDELVWSTSQNNNQTILENTFSLRFWDPGDNLLILPAILATGPTGEFNQGNSGTVRIHVLPPKHIQGMDQDSIDMAPIKPILKEPSNLSDFIPYIIALGVFALIALFIRFYNNRKKSNEVEEITIPETILPPHERAFKDLAELKKEELWQKGRIKEYQSRLTRIIRSYLENRFDIQAIESTTDEIVGSLKRQDMEAAQLNTLTRILQIADLVKFAKAQPQRSIHEQFMDEAVSFVHETKKEAVEE